MRWSAVAGVVAAATAAAVVLLGLAGSHHAVTWGFGMSGSVGVLGGLLVVHRVRDRRTECFRVMLAAAVAVWGAGQVVISVQLTQGTYVFASSGDLLSASAAPLALLGVLWLPRPTAEPYGRRRLAAESIMVGCALEVPLWMYWFRRGEDPLDPVMGGQDWIGLGILTAIMAVTALLLVVAVRDDDPGIVMVCLGLSAYVLADLLGNHPEPGTVLAGLPWVAPAITCAVWPVILLGVSRIRTTPRPVDGVGRRENRRAAFTYVGVSVPMVVAMVQIFLDGAIDPIMLMLCGGVMLGFTAREWVRGRQLIVIFESLDRLAHEDPLTGLGNRRALATALTRRADVDRPVAAVTLDVDRFKEVNSEFGHAAGDDLLRAVSRAIRVVCDRAGACPYRLSGDEFTVLVPATGADVPALAEALRAAVATGGLAVPRLQHLALTGSVGVAGPDPDDRGDPLRVLTRAADALRVAKESRDTVVVYDEDLAAAVRSRAVMERRLRRAITNGGLDLHFQPVIDLRSGRVQGLEALSRWTDDELGMVPPDVFVPLAEQTGLVLELGRQALDKALAFGRDLAASQHQVEIAVNVSPLQLRSQGFVEEVLALLHRHRTHPGRLVVEVTEGIFLDLDDPGVTALRHLAEAGVTIAIDDFGSGYSSLGYMSRLPADVLKVDRSLIAGLEDGRNQAVVRAIVEMAGALGLTVVVEGIETRDAEDVLKTLGAPLGQGWLYSAALPAARVPALLQEMGTVGTPEPIAG